MNLLKKFLIAISISVALWVSLRSDRTIDRGALPDASATATPGTTPPVATPTAPDGGAPVTPNHRAIGFRSRDRLEEHFQKHGGEFGRISVDQYLALAQALRDAPTGGDVLEVVRPVDGVISRFDRASGAFLAADADGTIRTFFKPNDGEQYFRRQAKRPPSP